MRLPLLMNNTAKTSVREDLVVIHPAFTSSSRMRVMNHNWSATKWRLHPQSVAEISCH